MLTFRIHLSAPSGRTAQITAGTANGTATAGVDYTSTNKIFTIDPGKISVIFHVKVRRPGTGNTVLVNLSNPSNVTLVRLQATGAC